MIVARRGFTLRENEVYASGEEIPAETWGSLRERTRRVLLDNRFVMTKETASVGKQKRGK